MRGEATPDRPSIGEAPPPARHNTRVPEGCSKGGVGGGGKGLGGDLEGGRRILVGIGGVGGWAVREREEKTVTL